VYRQRAGRSKDVGVSDSSAANMVGPTSIGLHIASLLLTASLPFLPLSLIVVALTLHLTLGANIAGLRVGRRVGAADRLS
jgi:hypothetical protein